MIERYSRPVMRNVWTEQNKFDAYLKVELYASEAWCKLGVVSPADMEKLWKKASFSIPRIYEIEQQTRHDVVAFTRAVSETLGDEATQGRACPLGKDATQTGVGEGPATAKVMLVGEQPGDKEDLAGHPFVGPAGQMLDRALQEAGIEQTQVFIASTDGDNTNLLIAQIAQKGFNVPNVIARVMDPGRAAWYAEQGLRTVCPTQKAIEMFDEAIKEIV